MKVVTETVKVVTDPGGVTYMGHYGKESANGLPAYGDLTEDQLPHLADRANRKAEELGITTRYVVAE